jgi:glycosyltransferase involved in cell wall biosynthesis
MIQFRAKFHGTWGHMGVFSGTVPVVAADLVSSRCIVVGVTHPQTSVVLRPRLRALCQAGFDVTLVCSPEELPDPRLDAKIDAPPTGPADHVLVPRAPIPMERRISPIADLVSLVRLIRLLRRLRPELVEFSTPKAGLLGTVAAALCGVPRRVYMLRGLRLETATGLKRYLLLACEWLACNCAHVVLCNSESLSIRALALRVAPEKKIRMLGEGSSNGVNLARFSPGASDVRSRLGIPPDAPVVGFVGRLTRDKGIPELMEAFDSILESKPNAHLLLVGWFDAAEDALDPCVRAGIVAHPRVHCTGFVEDAAPYYRAMDLMVLPTWREGFPNAVLEAQASGIPVVTTISTGSRDSVVPGVTGLLIPPGYPGAIAKAVLKLLRNPKRRLRMGRAARAWVGKHYMEQHVLDLTVAFYRELLADEGSLPGQGTVPAAVFAAGGGAA